MSHIKYSTQALVLDVYPSRDADRRFLMITRDFGTIFAEAKSIREVRSKLRYSLQKLSLLEVVVVRGKTGWKITNTKEIESFAPHFLGYDEKTLVLAKIITLVKRLVQGEERNEYLFDIIIETVNSLKESPENIDLIETLAVLRIMDSLGYIKSPSNLSPFLGETIFDEKTLDSIRPHKKDAILEINQALEESHL